MGTEGGAKGLCDHFGCSSAFRLTFLTDPSLECPEVACTLEGAKTFAGPSKIKILSMAFVNSKAYSSSDNGKSIMGHSLSPPSCGKNVETMTVHVEVSHEGKESGMIKLHLPLVKGNCDEAEGKRPTGHEDKATVDGGEGCDPIISRRCMR